MIRHQRSTPIVLIVALLSITTAHAAIKPHGLFSDGAVLQQGMPVPVWGTTDRDGPVTVTIGAQTLTATPTNGRWMIKLKPLKAGGAPLVMVITQGKDRVEVKDLLVGEVWIGSGQSNMQWTLKDSEAKEAIATAANDKIRLITIGRTPAKEPRREVKAHWNVCKPSTAADFSAVLYFFGRDVQKQLAVPVGLISANLGGTTAERWISRDGLEAAAELKNLVAPQGSSDLYNGIIAPLVPYAIRGALWYQGESNALHYQEFPKQTNEYEVLMRTLIGDWRTKWGQGDFPFLIVQLAPWQAKVSQPQQSAFAAVRAAQLQTALNVPNTAVAVITDLGDEQDIHPRKKEPVGARLALAARALAYGEKVEYSGPVLDRLEIEGSRAVLHFRHADSGLVAKNGALTGFTIAGEDHKFHNATARIDGNTVVVHSDAVQKPIAVRYGWADYPQGNLWNGDDLPASPFRTDEFPFEEVRKPKPKKK